MCTLSVTLKQNFQHFVIDKKEKNLKYHFCHLQMSSKVANSNYNFFPTLQKFCYRILSMRKNQIFAKKTSK
jgi:hypothetical protein